jgi:hypothetical protein
MRFAGFASFYVARSRMHSEALAEEGCRDAKGDDWEGVWTYTGGRDIGGEAWTRR